MTPFRSPCACVHTTHSLMSPSATTKYLPCNGLLLVAFSCPSHNTWPDIPWPPSRSLGFEILRASSS